MEVFRKQPIKTKKTPGRQPKFTEEFMTMVASKVADEGMTFREASKIFNVSTGAVNQWKKNYLKGNMKPKGGQEIISSEHRIIKQEEQIKDLKEEIGDLYLQVQMLKKMLSHSLRTKKENSSVITSENLDQFQGDAK